MGGSGMGTRRAEWKLRISVASRMPSPDFSKGERRGRRHSGFSLIELSMVLGIVSLILAGVMLFFENVSENNRVSDWITEMATFRSTMDSLSGGSELDPNADWTTLLIQSRSLPAKWIAGTNELTGPWHSEVQILPITVGSQTFMGIVTYDIPASSCAELAVMDLGQTYTYSVTVVGIGPMTPAEAGPACSDLAGTNAGYVAFLYPVNTF
jgi:prepilin-type N-terminal cleavage/methylation domain-containing protein